MVAENNFEIKIPVSILNNRTISVLEAISVYLKDNLNFNYHEIGKLTNRDERTIWTSYSRAKKKLEGNLPSDSEITIPAAAMQDRSVSILESIVRYLKDDLGFSYAEIARLLNRDDRTVWTCYARAKKKNAR